MSSSYIKMQNISQVPLKSINVDGLIETLLLHEEKQFENDQKIKMLEQEIHELKSGYQTFREKSFNSTESSSQMNMQTERSQYPHSLFNGAASVTSSLEGVSPSHSIISKTFIPVRIHKRKTTQTNSTTCKKSYEDILRENKLLINENNKLKGDLERLRASYNLLLSDMQQTNRDHDKPTKLPQLIRPNNNHNNHATNNNSSSDDDIKKRLQKEIDENRKLKRTLLMQSTKFVQLKSKTPSPSSPVHNYSNLNSVRTSRTDISNINFNNNNNTNNNNNNISTPIHNFNNVTSKNYRDSKCKSFIY